MSSTLPEFSGSGRPPPSGDQLAMLAAMLEEQQRFRVEQLAELHDQLGTVGPVPAEGVDPRREVTIKLAAAAERALQDVEAALLRLRSGTYGRCTACRRPIPLERLEILPQSASCVACQVQGAARRR